MGYRVPLRVTQYITYQCNLSCRYCARHKSGGMELSTEEIKSLMAAFRKAGTLFWGFNGGEALGRDDIGELIDFGKSIDMFVSRSTNGTLLVKRYREIRNADVVNISFEGPKDIHDELSPRRGRSKIFSVCPSSGALRVMPQPRSKQISPYPCA